VFDTAWWAFLFPGAALVLTVLAFNFVGDGLQDALDPRSRR
jgi:ABC-type dipeptide/oligopeptide/nickel transport system permease subunit